MENQAKIMVVDDELGICKNVEKILTKNNYTVVHTQSAAKALEMMKKESFSLLISDIVMPEMNGLELAEKVKEYSPDIKIILSSGYSDSQVFRKEIQGINGCHYLPKPYSLKNLEKKVANVLANE